MHPIKIFRLLSAVVWLIVVATSCEYQRAAVDLDWDYTPERRDSFIFARTHHYFQNYNFRVLSDSLVLLPDAPGDPVASLGDTVCVYENDRLVVADFVYAPADTTDTVWIKVARDQYTLGWLHEGDLLHAAVPDDPISQFIRFFGNRRTLALAILCVLATAVCLLRLVRRKKIRIVHFNDIDSFYPALFCLDTAAVAVLYATVVRFAPDTWQEFYFNPTLNPFAVPPLLSLLLLAVWLMVIIAFAAVDDVVRNIDRGGAFPYLLALAGVAMAVYLVFAVATLLFVGYPLFVAYVVFAIVRHRRVRAFRFTCGRCGHRLRHKGVCPNCGAHNV